MSDEDDTTNTQQGEPPSPSSTPAANTSTQDLKSPTPTPSESSVIPSDGKVTIMFKNTGNAPPLKQKIFKLTATHPWKTVQNFLRKQLKFKDSDTLLLFVNSTFQPSPDEMVSDLYKCFQNNGKLIVNYCTTAAWG